MFAPRNIWASAKSSRLEIFSEACCLLDCPGRPCTGRDKHEVLIMKTFATKRLPAAPDAVAPDGSDVRILLGLTAGGMAHFELAPVKTSKAVTHRTVEEIWFFISGRGQMWRKQKDDEEC